MSRSEPLRPAWLLLPLGLLYLASLGRMVWLVATRPGDLEDRARDGALQVEVLEAPRAPILDRNGEVLALDRLRYRLVLDGPEARIRVARALAAGDRETRSRVEAVARIAGLEPSALEEAYRSGASFRLLQASLPAVRAEELRARGLAALGLRLEGWYERLWPAHRGLAQVLGQVRAAPPGSRERVASGGLEAHFDARLQGRPGLRMALDLPDRFGPPPALEEQPPRPAWPLRTSLDAGIAALAREELAVLMAEHEPEWACAVVLDARSGALRAALTLPDFDPHPGRRLVTRRVAGPDGEEREVPVGFVNHAFSPIEIGSTCKPLILSRALDEGVLGWREPLDASAGAWTAGGRRRGEKAIEDVPSVPRRALSPDEVLIHSSNVCMAQLAMRMGGERLRRALDAFRVFEPTGLLPGERAGRGPGRRYWENPRQAIWTWPSVAIGYQLEISPVRLAAAYTAFLDGGRLHEPWIVEEDVPEGSVRVLGEEAADYVREALVGVVEHPPRTWLPRSPDLRWGGKSGTTRILDPQTREVTGHRSLFVAFGPAEEPALVVVVVASRPSRGRYLGSQVAGPVAGRILRRALAWEGVLPRSEALAALPR